MSLDDSVLLASSLLGQVPLIGILVGRAHRRTQSQAAAARLGQSRMI
jgi:hypothetical protein